MSERSLQPTNPNKVVLADEKQLLLTSNRVVVFGSYLSGAFELAKALEVYLKLRDIPNASVTIERDIQYIADSFYGKRGEGDNSTLPRGVIVLPEMRWYPEDSGMFVDTHHGELYADKKYETVFAYIKSICDKYRVPIVDFNNTPTQRALTTGLDKLLMASDEKPR